MVVFSKAPSSILAKKGKVNVLLLQDGLLQIVNIIGLKMKKVK